MKLYILMCVFCIHSYVFAGNSPDSLDRRRFECGWVGLQLSHTQFTSKSMSGAGLGIEYQLYKHFGLGYSFLIGQTDSSNRYLYCGGTRGYPSFFGWESYKLLKGIVFRIQVSFYV